MDLFAHGEMPRGILLTESDSSLAPVLALVMDELAHGLLVTTVGGRLVHANRTAHQELACRRVLETRRNVLHACTPGDGKMLQEALARASQGKRSLIELTAGAASLTLTVLPLKAAGSGTAAHAALLFARASVCDASMLCLFARSHGLTTTEEHVLGILCQGFSAPQIAAQMQVAVSTVRSHVRSLCAKTHSSGVRQLVNRTAVLPPVAPVYGDHAMH